MVVVADTLREYLLWLEHLAVEDMVLVLLVPLVVMVSLMVVMVSLLVAMVNRLLTNKAQLGEVLKTTVENVGEHRKLEWTETGNAPSAPILTSPCGHCAICARPLNPMLQLLINKRPQLMGSSSGALR